MRRSPFALPPWRTPEAVIERVPAVAALIEIGPEALSAIVTAPYRPLDLDERLARIVVVSRIAAKLQDKSAAIQYLSKTDADARLQSRWATDALQLVGSK